MKLNPDVGQEMTIGGMYYSRYHPHKDVEKYWEGAKRHELLIRKCKECGVMLHPSRLSCSKCLSTNLEWVKATGKGSIYSFSVVHYAYMPELEQRVPYVAALVALEEGVTLFTTIVRCSPSEVSIGMPVEVVFDTDNLFGIDLPKFQLANVPSRSNKT